MTFDNTRSGTESGTRTDMPRWQEHSGRFRSEWDTRHGTSKPWTEHEPAFRYGWEYGHNPQYRDRDFESMSSDMERDWPNRHNRWGDSYQGDNKVERTWNDFKDTVREGWEKARAEFDKRF